MAFPPLFYRLTMPSPTRAPSAEIKSFADTSTWRGRARLPNHRKSFLHFWQHHIDNQYLIQTEWIGNPGSKSQRDF